MSWCKKKGFDVQSESKLIQVLTMGSSVLSLIFGLPTPVTLTAGVFALIADMGPNELHDVEIVCRHGESYLDWLNTYFEEYTYVDRVEVELSFLEFV